SSFFFQAEDGIRDFHVTGVQTCALPICPVTLTTSYRQLRSPSTALRLGDTGCSNGRVERIGTWTRTRSSTSDTVVQPSDVEPTGQSSSTNRITSSVRSKCSERFEMLPSARNAPA